MVSIVASVDSIWIEGAVAAPGSGLASQVGGCRGARQRLLSAFRPAGEASTFVFAPALLVRGGCQALNALRLADGSGRGGRTIDAPGRRRPAETDVCVRPGPSLHQIASPANFARSARRGARVGTFDARYERAARTGVSNAPRRRADRRRFRAASDAASSGVRSSRRPRQDGWRAVSPPLSVGPRRIRCENGLA